MKLVRKIKDGKIYKLSDGTLATVTNDGYIIFHKKKTKNRVCDIGTRKQAYGVLKIMDKK